MLLTPEEDLLKHWIVRTCDRGFGYDKPAVLRFLDGFLHHDFENENKEYDMERFDRPGIKLNCDHKKWYQGFMNRHPEVRKRVPENILKCRADVTKINIYQWFSEIESII